MKAAAASFIAHFRALHDAAQAAPSSAPHFPPDMSTLDWELPEHVSVRDLRLQEKDWDAVVGADVQPAPRAPCAARTALPFVLPAIPRTERVVFDVVDAWLRAGFCNTLGHTLNGKQAAYLLLIASWLQSTLNVAWGFPATAMPSFQHSLLLGGPGTGKTYITNLATDLIDLFLPASTMRAAFTHRAAQLISGSTLHSSLSLPLDLADASAASKVLGHQKEKLQAIWRHISSFLIDEVSMLSNEIFAFSDLRLRQIFNQFAIAWGGLAIRLSGDFHQLPPVGATCLINPPATIAAAKLTGAWTAQQTLVATGADLWNSISSVLLLDEGHRCVGPLQTLLEDLVADRGITAASWEHLQHRCVRPQDPRLQTAKFQPATCPVGVLRHSVRSLATLERAEQAASNAGHRLLLAVAADRCSFANRRVPLTPDLATEAAAVHALSATSNLQAVVCLFRGLEVCLESKLCSTLGLVRGCLAIVDTIIPAADEPPLAFKITFAFTYNLLTRQYS